MRGHCCLLGTCPVITRSKGDLVLLQWQEKDPPHSAKSAGGGLHISTYAPLNQRSRSGLTISSGHRVGTYPETSLHAACQGAFGHSRLSSLSHCGPILA